MKTTQAISGWADGVQAWGALAGPERHAQGAALAREVDEFLLVRGYTGEDALAKRGRLGDKVLALALRHGARCRDALAYVDSAAFPATPWQRELVATGHLGAAAAKLSLAAAAPTASTSTAMSGPLAPVARERLLLPATPAPTGLGSARPASRKVGDSPGVAAPRPAQPITTLALTAEEVELARKWHDSAQQRPAIEPLRAVIRKMVHHCLASEAAARGRQHSSARSTRNEALLRSLGSPQFDTLVAGARFSARPDQSALNRFLADAISAGKNHLIICLRHDACENNQIFQTLCDSSGMLSPANVTDLNGKFAEFAAAFRAQCGLFRELSIVVQKEDVYRGRVFWSVAFAPAEGAA